MKKTVRILLSMLLVCTFMFNLGGGVIAEDLSRQIHHLDLSDPNEVCEGLFFLRSNASTNTRHYYLTDFDYFTTTGVSFDDLQSQQWRLVDAGNGYYQIISTQTGFYLTARADINEGAVSLTTNTTDNPDRQLWKFIETWNSGTDISYRIVPKIYENTMCLGLSDTMGMYGRLGEQKSYSANVHNDFNEWQLVNYNVDVNAYYDYGFIARYDPNNRNLSQSLISRLNSGAKKIFLRTLGVNFELRNIASVESTADMCKEEHYMYVNEHTIEEICPGAYGELCPISSNCTTRYKSTYDFVAEYSSTIRNINVFFTGHWLEDDGNLTYWENRSFYDDNDDYPYYIISMQEIVWTNNTAYYNGELLTYVHELAHHLGASDHYHDGEEGQLCKNSAICSVCGGGNARDSWCIMGLRSKSASALLSAGYDELFCEECLSDMKNEMATRIFN